MKNLTVKIKIMNRLLLGLSLLLLLTSCNNKDETTFSEEELGGGNQVTDSWICLMESFEEPDYGYKIYLEDNGDYVALSHTRMLKVSSDGMMNAMHLLDFSDDDIQHFKIYNDKIYRFHYENFTYDLSQPMNLQIYDFDLALLGEHVLEAYGAFAGAAFESENEFVLLENNPDDFIMTFKKLSLTDGLISEIVLSTSHSTHPRDILLLDSGSYLCTGRNNYFVDNSLSAVSELNFDHIDQVSEAKEIPGQGIYLTGSGVSPDFTNASFITLLDIEGIEVNSLLYDAGEYWNFQNMEINEERICLTQLGGENESGTDMLLSLLDYDLNIESTLEISGGRVGSDIILNENGSFSFVYGKFIDPDVNEWDSPAYTRFFKFDNTYTLPTDIIIQ